MGYFKFFVKYHKRLGMLLVTHMMIVLLSLALSICIALPLGYFLSRKKWTSLVVIGIFNAIYSIPSIALLTMMLPLTGLGIKTAVIVITIYTQFILLRSTITGFQSVPSHIMEASRGMGLGVWEILRLVELPIAAPILLSGLRLATISSIGIATIAASINSGGIGELLFEGIGNLYYVKIGWGIILSSSLSLAANYLLAKAESHFTKAARGELPKKQKRGLENICDVSL
jgi:osmoprotectant transport system permease protein